MSAEIPRAEYAQNPGDVRRMNCTAHIPGTGPAGMSCIDCAELHQTATGKRKRRGRCLMWAEMRGIEERFSDTTITGWWFGLPTISGDTASCKYFEERPHE